MSVLNIANFSQSDKDLLNTVISALRSPRNAITNSVIEHTRRTRPNILSMAEKVVSGAVQMVDTPQPQAAQIQSQPMVAVASNQQTVNSSDETDLDELDDLDDSGQSDQIESVDDSANELEELEEFQEEAVMNNPVVDEDDFVDETDNLVNQMGDNVDDAEDISEDFDDVDQDVSDEADEQESFTGADDVMSEEDMLVHHISHRYNLSLSLYITDSEGEVFERDGKWYTSKQPLRRGSGNDAKDAIGAVRCSLENFVDAVRVEGESLKMPVALQSRVVEAYVNQQDSLAQDTLSKVFDAESNATVVVSSTFEANNNAPWGAPGVTVVRHVDMHFAVPAIYSAAQKDKDPAKMLGQNLRILNNLINRVMESTNVEAVELRVLIQDSTLPHTAGLITGMISEGAVPTFDRGYAVFTVNGSDSAEAE